MPKGIEASPPGSALLINIPMKKAGAMEKSTRG
jgi:hypothetical protein